MKVTRLICIEDYSSSRRMEKYDFHLGNIPKDCKDPWIKQLPDNYSQVILAAFEDGYYSDLTIIWDKYSGWQNGFEHFNTDQC